MQIKVPVSVGELVDKLVILEIKAERIEDATKRANVVHERDLLRDTVAKDGSATGFNSSTRPRASVESTPSPIEARVTCAISFSAAIAPS